MIYLTLGTLTSVSYSSIFCILSMQIGSKSNAVMACMALAFFLLFLCLHTNQIMVKPEWKDGLPNPLYAEGARHLIYAFLHDVTCSHHLMLCIRSGGFSVKQPNGYSISELSPYALRLVCLFMRTQFATLRI